MKMIRRRVDPSLPLRILHVTHMPLDLNLGGPKACIELMNEIQAVTGWGVDWFSGSELPRPSSSLVRRFLGDVFRYFAMAHVMRVADQYDVIIAEQGNLSWSKKTLGFKGLLITRSSGLTPFLLGGDEMVGRQSGVRLRFKTRCAALLSSALSGGLIPFHKSMQHADLAILLNPAEGEYVATHIRTRRPPKVIPNGLPQATLKRLALCVQDRGRVSGPPKVVFIGRWSPLKGIQHIPEIARHIRQAIPECHFKLIGLGVQAECVLPCFDQRDRENVEVVSHYDNARLGDLLVDCTVGMFPSYVEGFGLAVLEKMAAGIPCVCFDIPGPRDIVSDALLDLLVPCPDSTKMAARIIDLIREPVLMKAKRSAECLAAATRFDLGDVASSWIDAILGVREQLVKQHVL